MATSRYKEAFQEGFNLAGLATAVGLSAALLNPIPLLVGIVAEAAYLLFVPDSRWYQKRLSKKHDAEIERQRQELKLKTFAVVRPSIRDRFSRLESIRAQIETQAQNEDEWFREAMRKLDFLMDKYLLFAQKEAFFVQYLRSLEKEVRNETDAPPVLRSAKRNRRNGQEPEVREVSDQHIEPTERWIDGVVQVIQGNYMGDIEEIQERLAEQPDLATQRVLEKRKEILERRHEYVGRLGLILHNLGGQMQLMHDTFGLINDEIRARSPEQVLADIDEVVITSNSLTEAIDEVTPVDELVARLGA